MTPHTVDYLLSWLVGEDFARFVGYTDDEARFADYKVVILPSWQIGGALPHLPLAEIDGTPLLFGEPHVSRRGDTLVVHADVIASTFFLVSRYEELARPRERDEHGRFPGRSSLPCCAGFIHRPVADAYGALLRRWLRETGVPVPADRPSLQNLYLTHDVDAPFLYRSWTGVLRSLFAGRGLVTSLKGRFGPPENDPWYTFPQLFCFDRQLQETIDAGRHRVIYFIKAGGGGAPQDKPHYRLRSRDIQALLHSIEEQGAEIGLHASYRAGRFPLFIAREKAHLEDVLGHPVYANRHHYLAGREPQDTAALEQAGITDDYTMGYADIAGFRLGTARPVRYIDPADGRVSDSLTLHPLTAMDATLLKPHYMGLSPDDARRHCRLLLDAATQVSGEATFLLHNSTTPLPC